jgi:hypothetical protein
MNCLCNPPSVEARFGSPVEGPLPVAGVSALGEVGPKERLHDYILNAFLVGQPDEAWASRVFGVRPIRSKAKWMPSASPTATTLASRSSDRSQLPNLRVRYCRRPIPSFGIVGLS